MSVNATVNGSEITLKINGRFDFNAFPDFRQALGEGDSTAKYVIDLSQAEYMDSSALGMLLLMREKVGGDNAKIKIVVRNPEIRKILDVANFQRMFELD